MGQTGPLLVCGHVEFLFVVVEMVAASIPLIKRFLVRWRPHAIALLS